MLVGGIYQIGGIWISDVGVEPPLVIINSSPTRLSWDFDADLPCSDVLMLWVMMAIVCLTIFKNILRGLKYKEFVGCHAELLM